MATAARSRPEPFLSAVARNYCMHCRRVFRTSNLLFTQGSFFYCPNCLVPHVCIYRLPYRGMYLHESTPIPSSVNCLNCSHTIDLPPISAAAESFLCPHCLTRIFYYRTARLSSLPPITTPAAPDLGDYGNHYWPPITTPALGSFIDTLPMRLVMLLPADSKTESCSICIEDFFEKERRNSSCSADIFVTMTKELPCGHYFHKDCIVGWLQRSNTCPLCRYKCLPAK